jgi:magnesium-transporting ATPase (P-type)
LYKLDGKVDITNPNAALPLNSDNVLLKGSILRNTEGCYGIAIYTGHHTKVMMNSAKPKMKLSDLEDKMNKSILLILLC